VRKKAQGEEQRVQLVGVALASSAPRFAASSAFSVRRVLTARARRSSNGASSRYE